MKKTLITLALGIGALIPFLSYRKEFYYLFAIAIGILLFFSLKKRAFTLTDLLLLFMLTIPLHTFRFGTENEFLRPSEIIFLPLFLWWLLLRLFNKTKEPFIMRKEFLFLIAYLFINAVSTSNSLYPLISIKRTVILAYLFLLTYIIGDIINTKEKLHLIVKSSIIISAFSAIIAILQSAFPQFLMFGRVPVGTLFGHTFFRAGVGWNDPNYYALYMGMNAAFTLSLLLFTKKRDPLLTLCFFLQTAGILVTFSRTIIISLVIVSLYLLYASRRKMLAAFGIVTLVLAFGIMATSVPAIYKKYPFIASVIYRIPDVEKIMAEPTLVMGHRTAAFIANWAMFLDHPFLGVGPFMAIYNFEKYHPVDYKYPTATLATHNQYLQLLSEKGIFGFLLYMGFIFTIILGLNALIRRSSGTDYHAYLVAFKAAIFVYLVASLTLETSHELQFWFTIGLSLALFSIMKNNRNA